MLRLGQSKMPSGIFCSSISVGAGLSFSSFPKVTRRSLLTENHFIYCNRSSSSSSFVLSSNTVDLSAVSSCYRLSCVELVRLLGLTVGACLNACLEEDNSVSVVYTLFVV